MDGAIVCMSIEGNQPTFFATKKTNGLGIFVPLWPAARATRLEPLRSMTRRETPCQAEEAAIRLFGITKGAGQGA